MTHPLPDSEETEADTFVMVALSTEMYARLIKMVEDKQHGVDEMTPPNRKPREVTLEEILEDLTTE